MFKVSNLTASEQISLMEEIAKVGVKQTPLTSLLLSKGLVGKANGSVQTWRERTIDATSDIGAIEGSETPVIYESARAELSNILEIFSKGASVSGTINAINVSGGNVFSGEVADRLLEIKVGIEKSITTGIKLDGSLTPFIRKMDGIEKWAHADNLIAGETEDTLIESEVKEIVKRLWTKGNNSGEYFALINSDLKEKVDALYDNKYSYIANHSMFGLVVSSVQTNYGTLNFILTPYASVDKITAFDVNALSLDFLRQPRFEALAKVGDSTRGLVVAEATLRVGSKTAVSQYTLKNLV